MFGETDDAAYLDTAEGYASMAVDVYRQIGASYDTGTAEALLQRIAERRAAVAARAPE